MFCRAPKTRNRLPATHVGLQIQCGVNFFILDLQGGFAWALTAQNYKNCVTNQLGVLAAAKLAVLYRDAGQADKACACKAEATYGTWHSQSQIT